MSTLRGLALHLALLAVAAVFAFLMWTREDEPALAKRAQVEVWSGRPSQVESVEFESDKRKVKLSARKDDSGTYFVGTMEKTIEKRKPPKPKPAADAGADAGDASAPSPAPEPEEPEVETEVQQTTFVAVSTVETLLEQLAPLRAFRDLGVVGEERNEEFGLHEPQGTLKVTIDGKSHSLVFGGTTPGGSDRYARDPATGRVYAVPGALHRDLDGADNRLTERKLHAFDPDEVTRIVVSAGERRRELVPVQGKPDTWASTVTPDTADETATTWMTKLDRLRPTKYVEQQPGAPAPGSPVVKIEYFRDKKQLGVLELFRSDAEGEDRYLIRSEHTRWPATVLRSSAEQVDQDLGSVLDPAG